MVRFNSLLNNNAVSEIVGAAILVLIAVSSFSAVYLYVFPLPIDRADLNVKIVGYVDYEGTPIL